MANENKLVFLETMSLATFKDQVAMSNDLDVIDVGNGPFFQARAERGAVAKEIDYEKPVVISKVHEEGKDGETFWLLHNKRIDNVKITL